MPHLKLKNLLIFIGTILFWSCSKDDMRHDGLFTDPKGGPTPYYLSIPEGFPDYFIDEKHLLTEEGVALGRRLFYDPILSKNRNISCSSCHQQEHAFSDPRSKSVGTHGGFTTFHSMPLFNIAWMDQFFWDGRAPTREDQALKPVINSIEMDMTWPAVIERLKVHPLYPKLFEAAFGVSEIDSNQVVQAIVQFEMTIVSADSKYDRYKRGLVELTPVERLGERVFESFQEGDCIHCHLPSERPLLADNSFHNNGLDARVDMLPGLAAVTGRDVDLGKFKTPSLRNLAYTAPYMHDGRFSTLEELIDFYSNGVHDYPEVDPKMEFSEHGGVGVNLDSTEKAALIAFLLTLTDSNLVTNPAYSNPFTP